jgi:tripartite-type tricarboxylate transporter receptor subunit TctC
MDRRTFLSLLGTAGLAGCGGVPGTGLFSESNSGRSVTFIVPAPAGSRTGKAGGILAASLQREIGKPVNILNVEGPGTAYQLLASAPPDGSTLGLVAADIVTTHRAGLSSAGPHSVTALALFNEDPAGIHVRSDAPWANAQDLTAKVRSEPGRLTASGAGRRAIWHLSTHRWITASGMDGSALPWEPAPGPAAAAEELVAGGGPAVVVCSVPEIRATPSAPRIRTLAVMAKQRSRRYPEIACLSESGLPFQIGLWRGVAGPRGLPPELAKKMSAALRRVYTAETFRSEMFRRGFGLAWADAPQFAQFMQKEDQAIGSALRAIG